MSFSNFALTKTWESADDFPTFEGDETKVRADMQCLFTELEEGIQQLIAELEKNSTNDGTAGANSIGIDGIAGLGSVTNVQSALAMLMQIINNIVIGDLPDGSVTTSKLANAAVTQSKIGQGAVGNTQLANASVTSQKLPPVLRNSCLLIYLIIAS